MTTPKPARLDGGASVLASQPHIQILGPVWAKRWRCAPCSPKGAAVCLRFHLTTLRSLLAQVMPPYEPDAPLRVSGWPRERWRAYRPLRRSVPLRRRRIGPRSGGPANRHDLPLDRGSAPSLMAARMTPRSAAPRLGESAASISTGMESKNVDDFEAAGRLRPTPTRTPPASALHLPLGDSAVSLKPAMD